MFKKLLISILLLIFIIGCKAQMGTTANPQATIKTAIDDCIQLLESKDYKTMLSKYVSKDDLEKILKDQTMDEFVSSFSERKADKMLNALKIAKEKKIEYKDHDSVGVIKLDKVESGPNEFVFIKIGDLWYISD